MKKYFILSILMLAFCLSFAFAENPNLPTNNGYPVLCNFGIKYVATPTIALDDSTLVDLWDYLPAGTIGFELRAKEGDFVFNNSKCIATGTNRVGRLTEEGATYIWNGNAGTLKGRIVANSATATVVIDGAWGKWSDDD